MFNFKTQTWSPSLQFHEQHYTCPYQFLSLEVLEQESKISYIDFGQTFHDQIDGSKNRINFLKQEIAKEKELILKLQSELKGWLSNSAKKLKRRRPPKSTERKVATKHLLEKWILALQTELGVSTRSGMEAMINSDQDNVRNLVLWRDGTRTPSPDSLLSILSLEIITGKHWQTYHSHKECLRHITYSILYAGVTLMMIKLLHFLVTVRKPVMANDCILQSGTMLAQTKIATIRHI